MEAVFLESVAKGRTTIAQSVESSAPDRRTGVRSSAGEKPPCTLMAPGECKIRRGCNVLKVPIQIIRLGVPKRGAISSGANQKCDGMSADHPSG